MCLKRHKTCLSVIEYPFKKGVIMSGANVFEFTDANFDTEVLGSDVGVVVDFWAPWCGPCKMLGPIIEQLAADFGSTIKIGKVNVDASPDIAAKYAINSIPTILFFKAGEVKDKQVGLLAKGPLKVKIENFIAQ